MSMIAPENQIGRSPEARIYRNPVLSMTTLALFLILSFSAKAQEPHAYTYRISIVPRTDEISVKALISGLTTNYEVTDIDIEEAGRVLWFVTTDHISYSDLVLLATQSDHRILGSTCMNNLDGSIEAAGTPPMPRHTDTGNEVDDHARYEAAKAEWIARYPQEYQRITGQQLIQDHDQ